MRNYTTREATDAEAAEANKDLRCPLMMPYVAHCVVGGDEFTTTFRGNGFASARVTRPLTLRCGV